MKKAILVITICILVAAAVCTVVACDSTGLQLYVPDGAPALSVAKIINDGKIGGSERVKTHITTGNDVIAKCSSGEADMAVLPTNAAVKICSTRDDYVLFSVNVYGTLYIVGTEQLTSFNQLKGQRLYSIGKGNTPEIVLKKICSAQNVNYREYSSNTYYDSVMVTYYDDASEIIPRMVQKDSEVKFALLGEPAASQLIGKLTQSGRTAYQLFDLQQLWQEATDSDQTGYPQASLIVKKSLLNDKFKEKLNESLQANAKFLTDRVSDLGKILQGVGSTLTVTFNAQIIERCHISYIPAIDARADLDKYLEVFGGMDKLLPLPDEVFGIESETAPTE